MSAMHELFSPQGSNPLTNLKVSNPRCSKVEFDRTVRSNVLVIEGDLTQSRVQIPKEDRPVSSLQLNHSLVVLQIMIPSSGQFLLELNVSNSPMTRMRLSAATFISRADVVDAKGMAHAKIPLVIPRNCWVQIVFHVGGIFTHLFRLPAVKWIDSVILAGSCKVRKVMTCADEAVAIESKPGGMLLFAVPAYGPPVWQTSGGGSVAQRNPGGGVGSESVTARGVDSPVVPQGQQGVASGADSPTPTANEVSSRTLLASPAPTSPKPSGGTADGDAPGAPHNSAPPSPITLDTQSARRSGPQGKLNSPTSSTDSTTHTPVHQQGSSSAPPVIQGAAASSPLRMKFLKGDDGTVSFTASNPEQAARDLAERRNQMMIVENLKREAETLHIREEYEKQRRQQEEVERQNQYVRIVEVQNDNGVHPISGRRPTLTTSNVDQQPSSTDGQPTASPTTATGGNLAAVGGSSGGSTIRKTSISGVARGGGGQQQFPASSSRGVGVGVGGGGGSATPPSATTLDGGLGCWDDEDGNIFSSMLAGGMSTFVVQTLNAGGKPIVVPRKGDDAALQPSMGGGGGGGRTGGAQRTSLPTRKPQVVLRKPTQTGPIGTRPKRKPTQPPSMLMLSLRPTQGDSHPADDYDPDAYRRPEPDVGYGCGFMDVLHGEDEEYEEDEEE